MQSEFKRIDLKTPINIDGAEVDCLKMREPTVADQLTATEAKGTEAVKEILLLANLCEVTPEDIKKLTLKDYKKVQEVFTALVG